LEEDYFKRERENMVLKLISEGVLKSPKVIKAMLTVPREVFVLPQYRRQAYIDTPLPILKGQTISAPHMVALMCELAELDLGHKVLEVGTGSGYHAAVIAEIVAPRDSKVKGKVISIERIPELVEYAKKNLEKAGYADRVTVILGDGTLGYPKESPYDRIIVTAAAPSIPKPLIEQLKVGGIMVIPTGNRYYQRLLVVKKISKEKIEIRESIPCVFVPLVGKYGWRDSMEYYLL